MKMNECKKRNEMTAMEGIEKLYEQMLHTGNHDEAYRVKLVQEILHLQKPDGSFSVIDDYRCDSDMAIDYVYYPTYYVTAALIYAANCDGLTDEIAQILEDGFTWAVKRSLAGHGYDAMRHQLEAMEIYKKAGVYEFLQKYGNIYHTFTKMFQSIIEEYRERLLAKQTVADWMIDYKEQLQQEVADWDEAMTPYVWYVAYGSNMNYSRFMRYIDRCTDKTEPLAGAAVDLPYNIYFAYASSQWERKGVAFLDDTHAGKAWGRMYKIKTSQFAEIQRMEGSIYSKKICLGTHDGIPMHTFTSLEKRTDINSPSSEYLNVILTGLKETYPDKTELVLETYLYTHGVLNDDDYKVLSYLRKSEHGVSVNALADHTVAISRVKRAVKKLISYKLIKQDVRSVRAGHRDNDPEAVVYTCKEKRELVDLLNLLY